MKHTYIKIALIALFTFNTVSCNKEFIDEPQPTGIAPTVIFASLEGMEAHIAGMVRWLRTYRLSIDSAALNSIYYARAVKGNDLINRTTWFQYDYGNAYREPTWNRAKFTWEYLYILVDEANVFIEGAENSSVPDADKKTLIAQAKAMRALAYFELTLEYQHTYSFDTSLPAPPLYKEPSVNTGPLGMSTLQEMYDFIIEDLTFAVNNLTENRISKSYINTHVANGILARVYQTTNNWLDAEKAAKQAYGGGNPTSVLHPNQYNNGFDDIAESNEWIWGAIQTKEQNQGWAAAPHVISDHNALSYYGTFVNNDFVNLFSDTDVRKLFRNHYNATNDSYRHWVTDKFAFSFSADIPFMRTPEMILIEAEAKYHNGDTTGAHNLLFTLQTNRDVNAVKSNNTGQSLLDEILVERRKELYAEFGVEWFDAKRYRKGITRTGNHRILSGLEPDDKKFFLKIPLVEIELNKFIDPSINTNR
ncbi:RagB/SusD family nutrient uptake outer membrane protein [Tenacibaculum ovolyticum]|uniref:RagB/SusD family nutrient uptake outer membrane protein n=1 Tax=Tenacibaculum ovolyticum TaxID=104270 RepID=UPI0022F3CCE7|nr:RagB/SusD family nutrient uptake outer membrane protein [Tenacibaculum ovolyticum]WBX76232.1 RagB/SusD family nutrient uptake outer membrane protein [Tenacibaculum ovolyticum]